MSTQNRNVLCGTSATDDSLTEGTGFPAWVETTVAGPSAELTGFYSPLSPCLWHLAQDRDFGHLNAVEFIEVDRAAQIEAAARVLGRAEAMTVAAEPSALIAFGAVKQLAQRIRDHGRNLERSVVLVVNSGFGIMGMEEQEFYTKSIFAFR